MYQGPSILEASNVPWTIVLHILLYALIFCNCHLILFILNVAQLIIRLAMPEIAPLLEDIMKEYGLEDYDEEEEGGEANLLGLGDLTSFADPKVSLKA